MSLASEYSFGLYRSKIDHDITISVGDCFFDMTDTEKWQYYINKEIYTLGYSLVKEDLATFSENYEKIELQPEDIVKNISYIRCQLSQNTKLIVLLGNDKYLACKKGLFDFEKLQKYWKLNKEILRTFYDCEDMVENILADYSILIDEGKLESANKFFPKAKKILKDVIAVIEAGALDNTEEDKK